MPTYLDPRHGVSLSEAMAEAVTVAPIGRAMLNTLEFRHPMVDTIRIVCDHQALTATLEAGAPEDAGMAVEFLPCPVQIVRPEESDQAASPSMTLQVDNVSGLLSDAFRITRGSLDPWEVTERIYASDDLSGPAVLPPTTLLLSGAQLTATTASVTASFGDPANVAAPRLTFNPDEYPGLS